MEKIDEMLMNGVYIKFYKQPEGTIDPIAIFTRLNENGIRVRSIKMEEDAEFDMKMHTGNYYFDDFCEKYPSFSKNGPAFLISTEVAYADERVFIRIDDNSSIMYIETRNKDIELTDMLRKH